MNDNTKIRSTILLNDTVDRKVRTYQASKIRKSGKSYSFSQAISDLIEDGFKKKENGKNGS